MNNIVGQNPWSLMMTPMGRVPEAAHIGHHENYQRRSQPQYDGADPTVDAHICPPPHSLDWA
jgi:hypothetical protein